MLVALIAVVILIAAAVGAQLFFRGRGVKTSPDLWVVSQLRQAGSNLSRPHDIEFFLYFPSEVGAQRIAAKLYAQGFDVKVTPSASGKPEWVALARRSMVPDVEELVRAMFLGLVSSEHGNYDGWGAPVVK